ncbi:MAG: zinc-ribbon domain-containing protein [Promethearchaeota archaeon]|jgi:rRNA maturation endonuclease Nob1
MTAPNKISSDNTNLKCPNCGTTIYDTTHKFCEFCGNELHLKIELNKTKSEKSLTAPLRRRRCC